MASLIATPATSSYTFAIIHGLEMIICLSIITVFAYIEFECELCAVGKDRQANNNPYIKMFVIAGWVTMVIDFISYVILLGGGTMDPSDEALEAKDQLRRGLEAM